MDDTFNKDLLNLANTASSMPTINPFEYPEIECPECKCKDFLPTMRFRKVPGLLVGESEDIFYPHKVFVCKNCGELSPISVKELEDIMKITKQENKQPASSIII